MRYLENTFARIALIFSLLITPSQAHADPVIDQACAGSGDSSASGFWNVTGGGNYPVDILTTGTADQIAQAVLQFCGEPGICESIAPWMLLSSSRPEVREAALLLQQTLAGAFLASIHAPVTDLHTILQTAATTPAHYSSAVAKNFNTIVSEGLNDSDNPLQTLMKGGIFTAAGVCTLFSLNPGCTFALNESFSIGQISTVNQSSMTAIAAAKSVFTDPNYSQGLAIAALHQQQEIVDARNGILPKTHLIDDLIAGFVSAGFKPVDASKMAFQFLGLYGARGASVDFQNVFASTENYPVMVATYLLTAGLGVLDAYTLSTGHPYSLPAEMQSTCSYGRPYHFWMAAYIANQLAGRMNSKGNSALAPHITGVGYESMGMTITRTEPYEQLTRPANDPANMSIRINITMNDAGAIYGANYKNGSTNKTGDIEGRLVQLVNASSNFVPLTPQAASDLYESHKYEYLKTWKKAFQPELGFKP